MRIGVYGGSFNPPHIGHLYVADLAMSQVDLDIIVFMPAGDPYMKPTIEMAPAEDRFNMVMIATQYDRTHYRVSDMEIERKGPSYTADTILQIKELYPAAELFLIVGGDAYEQMSKWSRPEIILDNCKLIVVCRDNKIPISDVKHERIEKIIIPDVQLNISSTAIRKSIKNRMPVRRLLPAGVPEYIVEHNLYCEE